MNSLSTSIDSVLDDDHAFIASDDHVKVHSVDLKGTSFVNFSQNFRQI